MVQGLSPLHAGIRLGVVTKNLSQLAVLLALLSLLPLLAALVYRELTLGLWLALVSAGLLLFAGLGRLLPPAPTLQHNEAMAIAALAFLLSSALMSIPMMASGLAWIDAMFESISAVTTTGLSMHGTLEGLPRSFLILRSWMQWYGGLGMVILALALLPGHEMAARRLGDSSGAEDLAISARVYARRTTLVYSALTLIGLAILWLISQDGFHALNHVLAAVSTGGFSSFDGSLAGFDDWPSRLVVILLCLCGAVPLALYYRAASGGLGASLRDPELHTLLIVGLVVVLILSLSLHAHSGLGWQEIAGHAVILGLSAQTTSGFSSLAPEGMDPFSKLIMIISMAIGGGVGSTAGGFKILRLLILMRLVQVAVQRASMPPHAVHSAHLGGRRLEDEDVQRALLLILLYVVVIVLSWLPFVAWGFEPLDALFEVVSATATVGLSCGITSPDLPAALKEVLMFDMLFGRMEIIALLVVLYPPSWMGARSQNT